MSFKERKQKRTEDYEKNVKGWKLRPCSSCNGTGYYDHNGSPKCGACRGSGLEKYKPTQHDKLMDIAKAIEAIGIDKGKGLMEQIRDEQNKPKPEINLMEELSKPPRSPNNNIIYCGTQFVEILQKKYPKIFGHFKY